MPEGPREPIDYGRHDQPGAGWAGSGGGSLVAPEVSRRVRAILDNVEREAAELRAEAQEEARRYLEAARRHVDGMVHQRQQRIAALSDEIISRSESVLDRLEDAAPVRAGFDSLVRALGDAAERLATEVEDMHLGPSGRPPYWRATPDLDQGGAEPDYSPRHDYGPPHHGPPEEERGGGYGPPERGYASPAAEPGSGYGPAEEAGGYGPPGHDPAAQARTIAIQMAAAGNTRSQVDRYLRDHLGLTAPDRLLDELFGSGSADDARVPWTR